MRALSSQLSLRVSEVNVSWGVIQGLGFMAEGLGFSVWG